jgi:phage terminase small subunit
MATQMESTPRRIKPRVKHRQTAEAQSEIDSSVVTKVTRQDVESLNEEQRRELVATIWREIYGHSPSRTSRRGS